MIRYEWRLDMRLKHASMLQQYMDYKGMTIRQLAEKAGVSHSTIGHLHSGFRNTTKAATAGKIERALDAPPGLLFEAVTSKVQREVAA